MLGAQQIMRLYRTDRAALTRLTALADRPSTRRRSFSIPRTRSHAFATPDALDRAYANRTILPLPSNPARLGLRYDAGIGSLAPRLKFPPALYRGLRPDRRSTC